MDNLDIEELEEFINKKKGKQKKSTKGKRMKTGKKALLGYFVCCMILVAFTMYMIYLNIDSSALNTLAEAGLKGLPVVYGIYQTNSFFINKEHMKQDYRPNYDEEERIY